MSQEILYLGYPIIKYNNNYIVYNIPKGEIITADKKSYKEICKRLGTFSMSSKHYSKTLGLNFCVTFKCNLACKYCSANANKEDIQISKEIVDSVFNYVKKMKPKKLKISFTGGEPTLCIGIIKYIVNKFRRIDSRAIFIINSNGVNSQEVWDYLIDKNFKIFISIDGLKETHDSQRVKVNGAGSFKEVLKSISYLVKKKANIAARATLTKDSIKDLPKLINLLAKLGVKILKITNVMECGKAIRTKAKPPLQEEFVFYLEQALKIANKKKIMLVSSQFINLFNPSIHCCSTIAGSEIIVAPNGNLTSCFGCYRENDPYSNYFIYGKYNHKTKKIDIDKNKRFFLQSHNVEKLKPCKNCFCKYICAGGCPLLHILSGKDKDFGKPSKNYCDYIKKEIKTMILNNWRRNEILVKS